MGRRLRLAWHLALLLALLGCSRGTAVRTSPFPPAASEAPVLTQPPATVIEATAEVETAAPAPAEAEGDDPSEWLGYCHSIADALPFAVDADMDGETETVDLRTVTGADEYPRWALVLTKGGQETWRETEIPWDMPYDLWVGDLDEDGQNEFFFHGDMASDDYLIYAWRCDLTPLPFEPDDRYVNYDEEADNTVFAGRIEGFEDGHIVIEGVVDMLGTHFGIRSFSIGDDGIIGPVSSVWAFNEEMDRALTVKQALRAFQAGVRKDPGEAFTLSPGDRICPLASDGCGRMWFETEGGKGGVLLLEPDEENMWCIDGIPEAEYFDFLPYSG